ncbi:uncharacterized protein LOC141620663 [Silene latifolia]|uniref:uncharacterized protein LOC141620663 n=1 Tax=Silene latifolia TaxID=37657 RepID=UPI003D770AB3
MAMYDGTEDPLEHINRYKQKMMVVAATGTEKEAWLVNVFNQQFRSSRKPEKLSSDLYRIVQRFEESTRDYLARFNVEKISISRCHPTTAVNAFRRGLHRDSDLYKDLTKHPSATFEEVKQMAEATYLEEDEDKRDLYGTESSSKKITIEKKNERAKPYSKNIVNKVSGETESTEAPPKLSEYGFTTGLVGVMKAIRELGQRARWPKKPTPRENDRRDASKRCEYHNDIGHNTEYCVVLRKEVNHLYSAGCLDHLLPKGAKYGKANTADQAQPSPPPPYSKDLPAISFDEADVPDEAEHHHDALIITLSIGNCLVKKILVDTGSSVNLIMLETLKNMGFSEKDLMQKAVPLVGFSGKTKQSLGEIVIPTFAGGMNKQALNPLNESGTINVPSEPEVPYTLGGTTDTRRSKCSPGLLQERSENHYSWSSIAITETVRPDGGRLQISRPNRHDWHRSKCNYTPVKCRPQLSSSPAEKAEIRSLKERGDKPGGRQPPGSRQDQGS